MVVAGEFFYVLIFQSYIFQKKKTKKILQVFQSSKLFQLYNCQSSIHNETFFAVTFLIVSQNF